MLIFIAFANAQSMLEKTSCNGYGNPDNSCNVTFTSFSFGQNFSTDGTGMFFFDAPDFTVSASVLPKSANVPLNTEKLPIRFFVNSDESGYNSAMSLIHTAYASRASVNVIFMNPIAALYKDMRTFNANRPSRQCYVNRLDDGTPFSILCPVMAITLLQN